MMVREMTVEMTETIIEVITEIEIIMAITEIIVTEITTEISETETTTARAEMTTEEMTLEEMIIQEAVWHLLNQFRIRIESQERTNFVRTVRKEIRRIMTITDRARMAERKISLSL
jgi:hypothetical protein